MTLSERVLAGVEPPAHPRLISDQDVDRALHWLVNNAKALGASRTRLIKAERMVGYIEALLIKASDASSDLKRKADARSDARYLQAINEEAEAAGEFETLRALRDAASLKIDAWRTESSTLRSIKL